MTSAQLLSEALLTTTAPARAPPLATQHISAAPHLLAAKLQSSVVLIDPVHLQPTACFNAPAQQHSTDSFSGVVLSPDRRHVAAYRPNQLLVAATTDTDKPITSSQQNQQQQPGQLQCVAVLPCGIRSVHWSPCGSMLAVCSKSTVSLCWCSLCSLCSSSSSSTLTLWAKHGSQEPTAGSVRA